MPNYSLLHGNMKVSDTKLKTKSNVMNKCWGLWAEDLHEIQYSCTQQIKLLMEVPTSCLQYSFHLSWWSLSQNEQFLVKNSIYIWNEGICIVLLKCLLMIWPDTPLPTKYWYAMGSCSWKPSAPRFFWYQAWQDDSGLFEFVWELFEF